MDIYEFLKMNNIEYERYDHSPVFTCDDVDRLDIPMPATKTKNLFLRDRKGKRHFLVTVEDNKSVDLKALEAILKVQGLSFASSERLKKYLDLTPGSVTILGIMNDHEKAVEVIIDNDLWRSDTLRCHPLVNTSTLIISRDDVKRFIDITGHEIQLINVPGR